MKSLLLLGVSLLVDRLVRRIEWPTTGKWGINPNPVDCPDCQTRMPRVRIPRNRSQALWGGWTCGRCGCEMDKYGVPVDATDSNQVR